MARLVTVLLQRLNDSVPWGFRIQGGADYDQPLSVQRVTPGGLASQQLDPGDIIIMIEGQDARLMCHFDACELIKMAGYHVELIVRKSNSQHLCDEYLEQQEKLEESVVKERCRLEEEKKMRKSLKESMSPPVGTGSSVNSSHSAKSPPLKCSLPEKISTTTRIDMNEPTSEPFPLDSYTSNIQISSSVINRDSVEQSSGVYQATGGPVTSTFSFPMERFKSLPIPTFPITSHFQRLPSEQSQNYQLFGASFQSPRPFSPPTKSNFQQPYPPSVSALPPVPKSFMSPPPRYPSAEKGSLNFNDDSSKMKQFKTGNVREKIESFSEAQSVTVSQAVTFPSNYAQKSVRSQVDSTVQGKPYPHSDILQSLSMGIVSPPFITNAQRRTSCSPQRIIPPLPKTYFPEENLELQNKVQGSVKEVSQIYQDYEDISYQTNQFTGYRTSSRNETPKLRLFSPKPFSPPVQVSEFNKSLSSPPVNISTASSYSAPVHMFSPPYPHANEQSGIYQTEINPYLLSTKLQALSKSEDVGSSSSQGSGGVQKERSISQEREMMTVEEYKQRQLQKLIEEKVRLEEMMMIAKRRQSVSDSYETSVKKKESKAINTTTTNINIPTNSTSNPLHYCKVNQIKTVDVESKVAKDNLSSLHKIKSESQPPSVQQSFPIYASAADYKSPAIREKEEETKLRKENEIRDEKIRRMQEKRYEEKLKKNLRSVRDKSCPPATSIEYSKETDTLTKDSKERRSRERSRTAPKGRIIRERSCPINLEQIEYKSTQKPNLEEQSAKDKTSLAISFISSMLRDLNIQKLEHSEAPKNVQENQNVKADFKPYTEIESNRQNYKIVPEQLQQQHDLQKKELYQPEQRQYLQQKQHRQLSQGQIQPQDQCLNKLKETEAKEKEERSQLFASLKRDQQKIQEEFRRREEQKKIKELKKKEEDRKAQDKLQHDAEKWHEQLQLQEEYNKRLELTVQDHLNLKQDKENEEKMSRQKKEETKTLHLSGQEEDRQKNLHELQEQLKRKEELQWQSLQKEHFIPKLKSHPAKKVNQKEINAHDRAFANENQQKTKTEKQKESKEIKFQEVQKHKDRESSQKVLHEKNMEGKDNNNLEKKSENKIMKPQKTEGLSEMGSLKEVQTLDTNSNLPSVDEKPVVHKQIHVSTQDLVMSELNPEEESCCEYEDEEEKIEDLRRQEEERMKEEAKIYEEYKRHLEIKRKGHLYDSDDYASEWDTGEEEDDKEMPRGLYLEEKFDELKATSEEELYEAQEKSIRNLDRQLRKQKQREMRKNYERRHQQNNDISKKNRTPSSSGSSPSNQKKYSSTGDLQLNSTRTLPITKFSPDPMEFGFRPIETPHSIISRSTGNLMTGGGPSASSIAHVAGAEAGVAAIKKPVSKKLYHPDQISSKEGWNNRYRISSSLEDLQQVSRKPPLPVQPKLKTSNLRHATSEETIVKYDRPCEDPRRHTYTEGEDFSELAYLDTLELEPGDYGTLLNEYYAAYYDTYYQSYYKRHRSEQKEGKMMNLGPPPPPPPPPFSTGAPAPAPKPPAEVPSKAPPPVAIPAALAGAMLKEKKPFTYTPGGLNLAEIKSPRMQRRLQRNASLEGVRPSPLAQQPPQSPGHSAAATIPTHGMIQVQVLPMPGMGMTPVARPQPKEPPKPKRNVCGPAPPPPPFVISGENSNEPSPSATPLTTPATTPASSSGISSAATSALSSQSTAPVSNSHSLETDEQSTKDKTDMAAELGSNIPSPPPPPPSTASQKRYSLPPLSSQQSASSSRSESESLQSSLSTFSPPYTASQFSNDLNHNEKDDLVDVLTGDEKSKSKTEEDKNVTHLHDDDNNQVKREVSNESVESTKEVSSTNYERESKGAAEINVEHKQTSPEIPITEDDKKNNSVQLNSEMNLNNKNESERLEKHDPEAKLETKVNAVGNNNLNFERSEENTAQSQNSLNSGKTLVQNNAHDKNNASNEVQVSSFSSTINVPLEKVKVNDNKVLPKTNEITQNTNSGQSQIYPSTPPTEIRNQNSMSVEKVSAVVVESKPSSKIKENHQNITSITFQPHRPNVRMATPPTEMKKNQNVNYDRMTRQASLPADGTSPQAIANKGSIYISPVRQISSDSSSQSKSAPQSAHCTSSSPTGLNKGPLPWMRGVKKESSPPPEFLIYAQKAQDRIQRQRSLTQQDRNQQYFDSQRNDTRNLQQNGYFQPSSPYSSTPNISMSSETSINNEPQLQCNWRLPAHQSSLKNQQVPKLQQTQQQKSNLQNFNQPQTTLGRQTYQPSFSQFSQQQSMTLPKNRPRERIIPIMMEDSSPIISTSNIHMTGGTNNFQNKMNNSYQHFPQRQQSWSKSSSVPSSPMGTSAAFSPFDDANYHSSSNALEALQQMQQNLAKLNCGLQTAQTPAQQNGAPFVIQHTGSHDPVQSRSFKLLQNAYDHQEPSGPPVEVPPPPPEPKKYAGSHIPSRSFRMLQTMTDDGPGPGESDL